MLESLVKRQSRCQFLRAFRYAPADFSSGVSIVSATKVATGKSTQPLWLEDKFQNEDLLPHVAEYLDTPGRTKGQISVSAWKINPAVKQSLYFSADEHSCKWQLAKGKDCIEFRLKNVLLIMFEAGVGFLVFEANPSASEELAVWQDFINLFHYSSGNRAGKIQVTRTRQNNVEPVLPLILSIEEKAIDFFLDDLVTALLKDLWPAGYRDIYIPKQLIPYVSLFLEGNFTDEDKGLILHTSKNIFRSNQSTNPNPEEMSLAHTSYFRYSESGYFVFSLDGASFVAFNPPDDDFHKTTLPDHLHNDQYFLLYLLASHQRFALMDLSERVADVWSIVNKAERLAQFGQLREWLLRFTAKGYFRQVMQREHHHRIYHLWQEVLQVHELYSEVHDEIFEIHETALFESTQQVERQNSHLNLLASFLAPPALLVGIVQTMTQFLYPANASALLPIDGGSLTLGAVGIGLLIGGALLAWSNLIGSSRKKIPMEKNMVKRP